MKRTFIYLAVLVMGSTLNAQTWKTQVIRIGENPVEKSIKIKNGATMHVGKQLRGPEFPREYHHFHGTFNGATTDSLKIKLKEVKKNVYFTDGMIQQTTIPAISYEPPAPMVNNVLSVAIADIDFLNYRTRRNVIGESYELGLFASLFVLVISPFICIDYGDNMNFNAERYKYFALGSTIGIVGSVTMVIIGNGTQKSFRFKSGWQGRGTDVWKFK
jgi:hypothetical protein